MIIKGYKLVQTCGACPEQYDVFKNDKKVAYLRLRHGCFRADVGDVEAVYYTEKCDGDGCFEESERMRFLTEAIEEVDKYLHRNATSDRSWVGLV